MANDRYLDWAKVFLESIRSRDEALPLYCIPHGGRMTGIAGLRSAFDFEFVTEGLDRLDAFGARLLPFARRRHRANLRKYVSLTLPVDEVAYFDIDMAMLVFRDQPGMGVRAGPARPRSCAVPGYAADLPSSVDHRHDYRSDRGESGPLQIAAPLRYLRPTGVNRLRRQAERRINGQGTNVPKSW
jgi:hypothetical protein